MRLWVGPEGGEQKSADVERKTVTLIYTDPSFISGVGCDYPLFKG